MGLMILSCVAALVFILLGFSGAVAGEKTEPKEKPPVTKPADAKEKAATRDEVRKKLQKLAETEAPKKLARGAMCYKMAAPPQRVEYVCPTCNEKTLYTSAKPNRSSVPRFIAWDLPTCRRMVKQIKDVKVALDESAFCKKCKPNAKKNHLTLVVQFGDAKAAHRVEGISLNDLNLLKEFFDGKLKHDNGQAGQKPLKDYLKRLETLLGVKLEETSK